MSKEETDSGEKPQPKHIELKAHDQLRLSEQVHVAIEKRSALWKTVTSLVATLSGVIVSLLSARAELTGAEPGKYFVFGVALAAMFLSGLMTFIYIRLSRGPSQVARLKEQITSAYSLALESSSLNPATPKR